jgi:hypothetical protein
MPVFFTLSVFSFFFFFAFLFFLPLRQEDWPAGPAASSRHDLLSSSEQERAFLLHRLQSLGDLHKGRPHGSVLRPTVVHEGEEALGHSAASCGGRVLGPHALRELEHDLRRIPALARMHTVRADGLLTT